MKMNKGAILASMAIIALASVLVGAGTMAYFNQTVQATGNTFTAGNLDIKLSTTSSGPWVSGPITGFWDSPTGWAPGESYTRRLYFKNDGNVAVQVVLLDFKNYVSIAGPTNFWDVIEVDYFDEFMTGSNVASIIATFPAGSPPVAGTAPLTLHELMVMVPNGVQGYLNNNDLILFDTFKGACPTCTTPPYPNISLMGGTYLAPGQVGWIELGFKFSSTAGIAYQNAQCSFDLEMGFIQGPDSGVCRHELPGWVP